MTRRERREHLVAWAALLFMLTLYVLVGWAVAHLIGQLVAWVQLHVLIVGVVR